jgi:hypothetical protein
VATGQLGNRNPWDAGTVQSQEYKDRNTTN